MGWGDFNDDDSIFGWDYIDYMNKTGIYEESHDDEDPNDELLLFGLDPDELENMSQDERCAAIEEAGLDPDDYDFYNTGTYSGNKTTSSRMTNYSNRATKTSSGKWSIMEFVIVITIISIIGYAVVAFGGELLGTIVIIIIFIILMTCF